MKPLDHEQYRVLHKRIVKIVAEARQYPAKCKDHEAAAERVLAPYKPREIDRER